jgi:5-oxoprolinase (ATP-hydrolysing) subunit A
MPKTSDLARKVILSPSLKRHIDLNTDYGQTIDRSVFDVNEDELSLLNWVSSVNIPCGVHDGEPADLIRHIETAKHFNCVVGAHIAYPDPVNHGAQVVDLTPEELKAWLLVQLGTFNALSTACGVEMQHVRPHGALYGKFFSDYETARLVAEVIYKFNPWAFLVGPAGPVLSKIQNDVGIRIAPEIHLGRRYTQEAHPAKEHFLEQLPSQSIIDQARQLFYHNQLLSQDGRLLKFDFKTLHLSPKLQQPVELAKRLVNLMGQPVSLPLAAVGASGWV